MGHNVDSDKQWVFPNIVLTDKEKKEVVREVTKLAVEVLFRYHVYSFKGSDYKQSDGGPIGLGATCAIARVCKARHSVMWQDRMTANNIEVAKSGCYVDDGRVFMYSIRPGLRWVEGGL